MNTEQLESNPDGDTQAELSLADKWIISLLQQLEQKVTDHLDHYRLDLAASDIYEFAWNEYCDWYVEFAKPALNGKASAAEQLGTRQTLVRVLEALLRLTHPIMPYITEELWQKVAPRAGKIAAGDTDSSIMRQPWPVPQPEKIDEQAIDEINWVKEFVLGVRRIRAENDIAPGKTLSILCQNAIGINADRIGRHTPLLQAMARISDITIITDGEEPPESATALIGDMRILIPLAGLIDVDAERERLARESGKLEKQKAMLEGKLGNASFTDKAPAAVVEKERKKLEDVLLALSQLKEQQGKLDSL
jgi:valyl-tRNA synthetase